VNATSSGIVNGTASASFVGGVLVVKSNATSGANVLGQSFVLTNSGNLTDQLTISAPTLASSYNIALPALPSVLSNVTIDTSGNMGTVAAPYQIVVGPGGNYTTIGAAITAASNGASIFILPGTYVENVVVNKALTIIGSGRGTVISGSLEFASGSSDSLVQSLKVTMGITIDSGVSEIQLLSFWNATGQAITDNGSGNYLQGMQE
jgi:pectin methylesterase-like acyl-CoA thioesterase